MNTDVVICYVPSDGEDWASYIKDKLASQPYKINCGLIDVSGNSHTKNVNKLHQSKVNVLFITPDFLEQCGIKLVMNFDKNTTVIVLAGVEQEDLDVALTNVKYTLTESVTCDLQQTEESVRELLITIISVFENVESPTSTKVFNIDDEDHYSVLPKPRQVNAMHHVFFKNDKVYVLLDRPADGNLTFSVDGHEAMQPQCTEFAVYWFPFKGLSNLTITGFQENNKLGECELNVQTTTTGSTLATSKDQTETNTCVPKSFKDNSTQTNTVLDKNLEIIPGSAQDISEIRETSPPPPRPCATKNNEYITYVNVTKHSKDINISGSKTELILPSDRTSKLDKIRELLEGETDPMQLLWDCLKIEKNGEMVDKKMASMVECSETLKSLFNSRTDCPEGKDGKHDSGFSPESAGTPRSSITAHDVDTPVSQRPISNEFPRRGSLHEDDSDEFCYDDDADSELYANMRVSREEFRIPSIRQHIPQSEFPTNNNTGDLKQETTIEKHKDIVGLLGMLEVPEGPIKDKGGIFGRFFKQKKKHTKSDSMSPRGSPKSQQKVVKVFTRDTSQHSTRSSGTSSSTASTYSNESFSRSKDGEEFEHTETRNSGKNKANLNMPQMLTNSMKRQSMRIKHAFEDRNLTAPLIPQKKTTHAKD